MSTTFTGPSFGLVGWSVAIVGDMDGDGIDDMAFADPGHLDAASSRAIHIVYGRSDRFGPEVSLGDADATLVGPWENASGGDIWLSPAGDVDADGLADLLAGIPPRSSDAGAGAILLYGGPTRLSGVVPYEDLVAWFVNSPGEVPWNVSGAGDVDADGFDDLLVATLVELGTPGTVHLVPGGAVRYAGTNELSSVGVATFLDSPPEPGGLVFLGYGLRAVGDLDGDGYGDIIVGSHRNVANVTTIGLFYGGADRLTGVLELAAADAVIALTPHGEAFGSGGVGDLNDDGYPDLMVARSPASEGDFASLHVLAGGPGRWSGALSVDSAMLVMEAETTFDGAGGSTASGDVDCDGVPDVAIGANTAGVGGVRAGSAYLLFGEPGLAGDRPLATSDWIVRGTAAGDGIDVLGADVALEGDVDRDGFDDLLVGAPTNGFGDTPGGRVFLYYGGPRP